MPGYVHIMRLGAREGTYGGTVGEYQFTYNEGGKAWVRTFPDDASLAEFLQFDVVVPEPVIARGMEQLHSTGKATITDLNIKESEAPALGLEQLPSDY